MTQAEARTEQQIQIRQVTQVQASWTEEEQAHQALLPCN